MTFAETNPEAWAIAVEQAASDHALLARLVREGKVIRDGKPSPLHAVVTQQNMMAVRPTWQGTIRPKSKRRKR